MEHSITQYKHCVLVNLKGRVDSLTAPDLGKVLKSINDEGRFKIVLDMSGVNFLSSAGWWTLINAQKRCKQYNRGEIVLACLDPKIRESMDLVGIQNYFKLFDDATSGVAHF